MHCIIQCSSLKEVNLPNSLKYIGNQAFEDCSALNSINIPQGVDNINGHAFKGCSALQTLEIPENVKQIGFEAFNGCSSLKQLKISSNIRRIDMDAFGCCNSLQDIYILCDDINSIEIMDTFDDVDTNNCVLHVPSGTRWEYRHHLIFGKFKNIASEEGIRKNIKPIAEKQNQNTELDDLPF